MQAPAVHVAGPIASATCPRLSRWPHYYPTTLQAGVLPVYHSSLLVVRACAGWLSRSVPSHKQMAESRCIAAALSKQFIHAAPRGSGAS